MSKLSSLYILGGGILLACGYVGSKLRVLTKQIDSSVEDLSKKTAIDISQQLVDSAVKKAINDYAEKAAKDISDTLTSSLDKKINTTVKDTVASLKKEAVDTLSTRMNSALADISDSEVRKEIVEQAKNVLAKRFEKDLADISADYRAALRKNLDPNRNGGYTIKIL